MPIAEPDGFAIARVMAHVRDTAPHLRRCPNLSPAAPCPCYRTTYRTKGIRIRTGIGIVIGIGICQLAVRPIATMPIAMMPSAMPHMWRCVVFDASLNSSSVLWLRDGSRGIAPDPILAIEAIAFPIADAARVRGG